jgi:hypothetical protein
MDLTTGILLIISIALLVIPPVILLWPLVSSIADRISGKKSGAKEIADLKKRICTLETVIGDLQHKVHVIEESSDFKDKLIEDSKVKTP